MLRLNVSHDEIGYEVFQGTLALPLPLLKQFGNTAFLA